ncbi:hypothetical protein CSOJ01_00404 [Colletotrichum sojae]|uniref:Uncharacterized protein n=1 Tax=Colletotrichum sojae TaxID=2175907 RepID=A0A8H6N5J0_9PEZI|nr:hypothetical protein CSOJ01_00404 [Colletotrichum sojae]
MWKYAASPLPPPETSIGPGAGVGAGGLALALAGGTWLARGVGGRPDCWERRSNGEGWTGSGRDGRKPSQGQMNFRSIPFVICAASSKAQEFQALAVDLMPASPVEVRRVS